MTPSDMNATQACGPVISDVLAFAMLRPHDLMDVVSDLVEEDLPQEHRPQESELQEQRWGAGYGPIDEHLYPRRLPLPRLMVETRRINMPDLSAKAPGPGPIARAGQRRRVRQHYLAQTHKVLRRYRGEQFLSVPPRVKGWGVVSIGLDDFRHRGSGYSGPQLEGTASNKALQLTKPAQAMELCS
jgi:hypothetical protein